MVGYGYEPRFVEGSDPAEMHPAMAAALDEVTRSTRYSAARDGPTPGR